MNRLLRCSVSVLCAGLVFLLSASAQTAPAPARAAAPAAPGAQNGAGTFKNLKVLPDTISRDDLRKLMRQFTGDLGVQCEFCHAAADPVTKREDRASDANPVKETARYMIQMTEDINTKYLAEIPNRKDTNPVTCGTCHRGEKHPSVFVAPPRQEGNRGGAAPPAQAPSTLPPAAVGLPAK
ncbi:MAG: c-type cytochrome [Acidobacteriaceae bacterium]